MAPDDRAAVPDACHRVRVPSPEEPGPRPRRGRHRRGGRVGGDPVRGGRRGVRGGARLLPRVRRRARGQAGPQAGQHLVRAGRGRARLRAHRAKRGLVDVGHLRAGQKVQVTGASGGVGSYAVQLAKALGAEVTAVASTSKTDLVRSLGADHVIDYTREDFADGTRRHDLILDIAGNSSLARLRRALTPRGTVVILGGEQGGGITGGFGRTLRAPLLSRFVSQRLTMVTADENGRDLERLTVTIEAGQLTPHVDRSNPLEEAA